MSVAWTGDGRRLVVGLERPDGAGVGRGQRAVRATLSGPHRRGPERVVARGRAPPSLGGCDRGGDLEQPPDPGTPTIGRSHTPTPRSCSSATPAWARPAWPSAWSTIGPRELLDRRRLGDAAGPAPRRSTRRRARNLAVGLRRAGRLPADPPALHGRHRAGRAGLQSAERRTRSKALGQWDHDLDARRARDVRQSCSSPGGAIGAGLTVSRRRWTNSHRNAASRDYLETSASTARLRRAARGHRRGTSTGRRSPGHPRPTIFKRLKDEILKLRDEGRMLLRMGELKQQLELRLPGETFTPDATADRRGLAGRSGRGLAAGIR